MKYYEIVIWGVGACLALKSGLVHEDVLCLGGGDVTGVRGAGGAGLRRGQTPLPPLPRRTDPRPGSQPPSRVFEGLVLRKPPGQNQVRASCSSLFGAGIFDSVAALFRLLCSVS